VQPGITLLKNGANRLQIHLQGPGNGFRGLSAVMSLIKNSPLEFGPLTENIENFLEQIFASSLRYDARHFPSPFSEKVVSRPAINTSLDV